MSKISGEHVINNLQSYRVHIKGETKAGHGESMRGCFPPFHKDNL